MPSSDLSSLEYQFQQLAVTKCPPAGLVIAIDFGTTFSGVAFARTETLKANDVTTLVNNIGMIRSWGASSFYTEKTPTILSYTKTPPLWGGSASQLDPDEPKVTYFKLGLQPGSYSSDLPDSRSLPFLKPGYRHPTWPDKTAQDFAEDYLKSLVTYIREKFFPSEYGPAFLAGQRISWVITIPAIWKDAAKDLTRKAAEKAGIPGRNLKLITEPEAAALYSASLCHQVDLKPGDRFLICDAGGGTVDLIAYQIHSLEPFDVRECNVGSGGTCGAVFLHEWFLKLLYSKLGSYADTILTPECVEEVVEWFERYVKRVFNPYDSEDETKTYRVPMHGSPEANIPEINLRGRYLKLSRHDIQVGVFLKVFDQIRKLVKDQLDQVQKKSGKIKTMFLVGGFGSNLYLYDYLKRQFKSLNIQQPAVGHTAIMKGAVLYRLGMNSVKERMMRDNYGLSCNQIFRQGVHPESSKYVDARGEIRTNVGVEWIANKGRKMTNGQFVPSDNWSHVMTPTEYAERARILVTVGLVVCNEDIPPEYINYKVSRLCTLEVDLSPLKPFEEKYGSRGLYYETRFEIAVTFGPEILYGLVSGNRVLGSVSASYY